ncbi:MAG: transporter [Bacteroidetes bacterium]|nr:MAG: transporter [Bacteroidota bacterium]PTM11935.1 MAG: transporter [Bacteroidota bacterium]
MEIFEFFQAWLQAHPVTTSVIKYLVWVLLVVVVISLVRRLLRQRLPDSSIRYNVQKGIEIIGYILIVLLTVSYFTGNIRDVTLIIGLLTAGITITLQELVLSVAGSFFIFLVKVYQPGDRIEINGIKGDVIDVNSIYTTMMEIGEWISSDNYSGRIVKLSNAFVFKGPIYNYSQDFPFVWDEFNLPIRYGSDMERAKAIVSQVASEILSEYVTQSLAEWKTVVQKYYIEDAEVNPTLAITLTDNWIQFNLRYIVDYKKRRFTRHLLHERIGQEIEKTAGKVQLASATVEIVRIPVVELGEEPGAVVEK